MNTLTVVIDMVVREHRMYVICNRAFTKPKLWTGLDHGLESGLTAFISVH